MSKGRDVIVFYGAMRSGSTMLRLMLNAHSKIGCPGERDFMLDALRPEGNSLVMDTEALEEDWIFRGADLPLPQARDGITAFEELLVADLAKTDKQVHVVVLHRGLARLLQVMPEARFIHLLRDPRDVAHSSIGMGWAGNSWYGVEHWLHTENQWAEQDIPQDRVCTLHYEDLLKRPEKELQRLCSFMGLDYEPAMLNYASDSTYESVDPTLAYQWQHKQNPKNVSDTEWKVASLMARYGYDPSPAGPQNPGFLRRIGLAVQNKVATWRVRIRRFGLRDSLILSWGKRGGPEKLTRTARRRVDAKRLKYLK